MEIKYLQHISATLNLGIKPVMNILELHEGGSTIPFIARYRKEATALITGMFVAARFFQNRLPEVFAGYARQKTGFPVKYPTASSPQAWATGAPLLAIRVLLGMEPKENVLTADPFLPEWIGTLAVLNVPGRWGRTDVVAEQKGAPTYHQIFDRVLLERDALYESASL